MTHDTDTVRRAPGLRVKGTILAACIAVLVAQLANALPGALNGTFQVYFETYGSQLTWITAGFMLPVVVFELTFGVLGDRFGHRKLTVIGALTMVIGSLVCVLAPTVQVMWVGSAINGLGAGAVYPASLALIAAVTVTPQQRARGIATWAGCLSAGAVIAPMMGGTFAAMGYWQAAYIGLGVLSIVIAVLCLLVAAESTRQRERRLDPWGQVTFALGLLLVLFGLVQGPEAGWSASYVVTSLIVGAVLMAIFMVLQLKVDDPLLRLSLFKNRAFSVSSIIAVVGMFAFLGICFCFSMWLGPVQHQNPMSIGVLFLLLQGPAFVLIPVISALMTRVPDRWMLTAGLLLMALGGFFGSRLDVMDRSMAPFVLPALLTGLGFALTLSTVTAVAINSVPRELAGMASATTNLLRDLGFALGPVLVGAIALSTAGPRLGASLSQADLPPDHLAPAQEIFERGGPFAVNSLPVEAPGGEAASLALQALGEGFSTAFLICALASLAVAILAAVVLRGGKDPQSEMQSPAQAPQGQGTTMAEAESVSAPAAPSSAAVADVRNG
ncbi:MAG: MFS transporter [Micrococcaceae bacterium]